MFADSPVLLIRCFR